jgi:hypothetical protein
LRRRCSEGRAQEEGNKRGEEDDVVERFIGFIVSFVVLAGMGFGLPRWFEWRRSLITQLQRDRKDAGHV